MQRCPNCRQRESADRPTCRRCGTQLVPREQAAGLPGEAQEEEEAEATEEEPEEDPRCKALTGSGNVCGNRLPCRFDSHASANE